MTNPIITSTTDSKIHNNIVVASLRDRPSMLATGRYAQWQSGFLRYVDTRPNGDALGKCILQEWSRFVITIKKQHDLDTVLYHKLFDVLKHYRKEVNEIRAKRMAKNANLLALVTAASQYLDPYYQTPKSHKPYAPTSKQSSSTRSNASTKFKGKEIAKSITPSSESPSEEDNGLEQAQKDKDMQKTLHSLQNTSSRYKNNNQTGQFMNQRISTVTRARETVGSQKPNRVKDYSYHKEKILLCKQAEKGVPLQVEQAEWLANIDDEIDKQELEAHYIIWQRFRRFLLQTQEMILSY
nr:hypothetical protein [Tanacetum cinerariifolium]